MQRDPLTVDLPSNAQLPPEVDFSPATFRGGPAVAKQILVYPILDYRTVVEDPQVSKFLIWTAEDNITGWSALLGPLYGTSNIPETAAPGGGWGTRRVCRRRL
jgi:hypothetical protein